MHSKSALFFLGFGLSVLAGCSSEAPENGSSSAADPQDKSSFSLEYEKFTLENGLEVILQVDRSDPIVAFTTVVHAGSNREKPGRTGFAHFFEHMAFNDSENVPRGWNRKAIPDWGGQRNGGTWRDGTIYYEVVPKDAFDKIMWIDSDRLGYMINTVTQEALQREIQVVKNEKRQRGDNAPYGYTREVVQANLYPEGHPYHWTVIGSLPDLQAATLDDLKEFYNQYYGASNATLAIVGDINIEETKAKVERWFGEIRPGPQIEPLPVTPVSLAETKKLYFEDNFAKLPELRMIFPTVEDRHDDVDALNVLASLLADSKNSPLHKMVVERDKLAPSVAGYNNSLEIAGEFVLRIRANAGADLDDVAAAVVDALAAFEEEGVDANDLRRIKAERETELFADLSTVLGRSNQFASDNEFFGDPAHVVKSAEKIAGVTADDVMAVYRTYIKDKPSLITSFVPAGMSELALSDSTLATVWIEEVVAGVANEEVSQGAEAAYEKTPSAYDRSEPPFGDLPLIKTPAVWEASLPGGAQLLGTETSETPLVVFDIMIDGGGSTDPLDKKGMSQLLTRLMNEGTAEKTAAELEQAIGLTGANVEFSANNEEITITVVALSKNFEEITALVDEVLATPRWEETDFNRAKSAALTSIKGREASPGAIAAQNFLKRIYGDAHPFGTFSTGTAETVARIELADLQDHHQRLLSGTPRFHIAGDISRARATAALTPLAAHFSGADTVRPAYQIPEQADAGKVFFIDVPGSKQSVINIGKLALATPDPDANKLNFANEKLGGGISGDLAQTLRIEKGYTYGAVSRVVGGNTAQPFRVSTSVRANATQASLEIIRDMLTAYGPDFTAADKEMTTQKLIKKNALTYERLDAKLRLLRAISKYEKSKTFVEDEQRELIAMSVEEYKRVVADYLDQSAMIYVVVGDKETQFDPVNEFASGEAIELDIHGNVVE